jgi:hypothetical protein
MILAVRLLVRNQRSAMRENYGFALMVQRPSAAG